MFVPIEYETAVEADIPVRVTVFDPGERIGDGAPDEARVNPVMISIQLGVSH